MTGYLCVDSAFTKIPIGTRCDRQPAWLENVCFAVEIECGALNLSVWTSVGLCRLSRGRQPA